MESIEQDTEKDDSQPPEPTIPILVDRIGASLISLLRWVRPAKADKIRETVAELASLFAQLLEMVIGRSAAQSALVASRLIARQKAAERRLETQAKEISDLHIRLDTRAAQIDDQEERIRTLEKAREVGGDT